MLFQQAFTALKLADENIPDKNKPPYSEIELIELFLSKKFGYDAEEITQTLNQVYRETLIKDVQIYYKKLKKDELEKEKQSNIVKQLFLENFYPEYIEEHWGQGYEANRPSDDKTIVYLGKKDPKKITWTILKHPHPNSNSEYDLENWVSSIDWSEFWYINKKDITSRLRSHFSGKKILIHEPYFGSIEFIIRYKGDQNV